MPATSPRDLRGVLVLLALFFVTVVLWFLLLSLGMGEEGSFLAATIFYAVTWGAFSVLRARRRREAPAEATPRPPA